MPSWCDPVMAVFSTVDIKTLDEGAAHRWAASPAALSRRHHSQRPAGKFWRAA